MSLAASYTDSLYAHQSVNTADKQIVARCDVVVFEIVLWLRGGGTFELFLTSPSRKT